MKLPRSNKKGITLVEVIVGVFVLSIFAVGILSLLIYHNQAVSNSAIQKADYSAASQKIDMIIAAVANSSGPDKEGEISEDSYLKKDGETLTVDEDKLRSAFDLTDCTLNFANDGTPLRGWYITLTYKVKRAEHGDEVEYTTEVKGYASYSQGAFDK